MNKLVGSLAFVLLAAVCAGDIVSGAANATIWLSRNSPEVPVAESSESAARFEVSTELEEYLATLSEGERAEFTRTMLPAKTVSSSTVTPLDGQARASLTEARDAGLPIAPHATGCWTRRANFADLSLANTVLYKWWHVTRWCATGTKVTSASVAERGGQPITVGWRYAGVYQQKAGVSYGWGRSYAQHKFILGVGGWDVQTTMPCGRVSGGQSGSSFFDRICGIY